LVKRTRMLMAITLSRLGVVPTLAGTRSTGRELATTRSV
jgi:hypothetical protein